ncbi:MAG: von Willebrand factor type A domain-containing protein, partial [Kiritimatiellia bacterium]
IQDLLTPYLLGDLDPAQAAEARAHLQTCALCRDSGEDLQATIQLLREGLADTSSAPSRLPESFVSQFRKRRWRRPRIAKPKPAPKRWWISVTQWAAVAAVFLVLAGLFLPNLGSVREKARRVNDLSNLNAVWKSASAWGLNPSDSFRPAFPPSLDELAREAKIPPEMLVNHETGNPVEYYPDANGDRPLLVSRGKKGMNVVKVAGQGMWVDYGTPEAEALNRQLAGMPKKMAPASTMAATRHATVSRLTISAPSAYVRPSVPVEMPAPPTRILDGSESDVSVGTGGGKNMFVGEDNISDEKGLRGAIAPADYKLRAESEVRGRHDKPADELELMQRKFQPGSSAQAQAGRLPVADNPAGSGDPAYKDAVGPAPSPGVIKKLPRSSGPNLKESESAERKKESAKPLEIENAERQRLVGVRNFQKGWAMSRSGGGKSSGSGSAVGGYAHGSAMAVRGAPASNAVPVPEPAARNAPPVIAPICRAAGVNPFVSAADKPFSTFSIDVDTASYTLSRNYLLHGQLPPPEAVRTEEFVNYFDYDYAPPNGPTFAVYVDCGPSAFGRGLALLKIGVKGRRLGREEKRAAILTLLIDTSGSMATPDRIELVKDTLARMVEKLDPADKIAIVQYDSHARLLLEHTPASDKKRILAVIEGLQTSGSTSLEEGMREAYATAARGFDSAGCNRVLLLSDGMANLGTTTAEEILKSIGSYRKQGVTLSVFGFGLGAYNDVMLETLANKGDGVYAFIDSPSEAQRILVDDLAATVNLIARDVKIQVEFNPKRVKQYRQLGYENRQLKKEQFRDNSVDAGEIGSGQSVTALYELELHGDAHEPLGMIRIRCRNALTGQIEEIEQPIMPAAGAAPFEVMDARFRLAAAAAEFSEILRGSPFAAGVRFEDVARVLRPVALELSLDNRIREFLRMTQTGLTPKFQEGATP